MGEGELFTRDADYRKRNNEYHALLKECSETLTQLIAINKEIDGQVEIELGKNEGLSGVELAKYQEEREKLVLAKRSKYQNYAALRLKADDLGKKIETLERADPRLGLDPPSQ